MNGPPPLDRGCAFDSNLLLYPTQRRLVTLWMENAGCTTVVVPTVFKELRPLRSGLGRGRATPGAQANERMWERVVALADSPYELVALTDEQNDIAAELLESFTLPCFPKLRTVDEIAIHRDANIVAEAVAADVPMIVTNNLESIDHREINSLIGAVTGRNERFVQDGDNAVLDAHNGGDASDVLLTIALASCWPDDCRSLTADECSDRLDQLRKTLIEGVGMPSVAQRLRNTFDTSGDLDCTMQRARSMAEASVTLRCEREWISALRDASRVPVSHASGVTR